jgi:hypothetical protein
MTINFEFMSRQELAAALANGTSVDEVIAAINRNNAINTWAAGDAELFALFIEEVR